MVVTRVRVLGACCVAFWVAAALGCASEPPRPHSADLIMPEWVEGQPTASKSKTTKRLEEKKGLVYGDPVRGLEPTDEELKASRAARRERAEKADRSTLLPKSSDSKFFGGSGCIETPAHKCP